MFCATQKQLSPTNADNTARKSRYASVEVHIDLVYVFANKIFLLTMGLQLCNPYGPKSLIVISGEYTKPDSERARSWPERLWFLKPLWQDEGGTQ
jgi:hypothetical protein